MRLDGEDQNALLVYEATGPEAERGFRKILTGLAHPDYAAFCLGPEHGTGYQDQTVIEAKDVLAAIETGAPVWLTFEDRLTVACMIKAIFDSSRSGAWVEVGPGGAGDGVPGQCGAMLLRRRSALT